MIEYDIIMLIAVIIQVNLRGRRDVKDIPVHGYPLQHDEKSPE
jgi:hypothetical protein